MEEEKNLSVIERFAKRLKTAKPRKRSSSLVKYNQNENNGSSLNLSQQAKLGLVSREEYKKKCADCPYFPFSIVFQ